MKWFIFTFFLMTLVPGLTATDNGFEPPTYGLPIPETAWQVRQDPERDLFDAAFLVHYTSFENQHNRHYRLIRILSEQGKAAAEFLHDSETLSAVKGRVLYPDGTELGFDSTADFVEILTYRSRRKKVKATILIPPGLTTDCLVEMEWFEAADLGLKKDTFFKRFDIRDDYYCLSKTFDMGVKDVPEGKTLAWVTQKPKEPITLALQNSRTKTPTFTFNNIPPRKSHPFGNPNQAPNAHSFIVYRTLPFTASTFLRGKPVPDWNGDYVVSFPTDIQLIARMITYHFDNPDTNKAMRVFSKEVKHMLTKEAGVDLKKEPIRAAKLTLTALHERISVSNRLNAEQLIMFRNKKEKKPSNLKPCFRNGWADPFQINLIFVWLLRELNIQFQFVYANPVTSPPYKASEKTPFSFDWRMPLIMVKEPQQRAMFCAWRPEFEPGMLPSELQGTAALAVNPYRRFFHVDTDTPHFGATANQLETHVDAELNENGSCRLRLTQTGTGVNKSRMVRALHHLREEEQGPFLRRHWKRRLGNNVELLDAQATPIKDLKDAVTLTVDAQIDHDEAQNWFEIDPFPGLFVNLPQPKMWPADRTQPIVLDYAFVQTETMTLRVPSGWTLKGKHHRHRENRVGTVTFEANQEGNVIRVQRTLTLTDNRLEAEAEPDLRFFLAWAREANLQTIAVAKGDAQ